MLKRAGMRSLALAPLLALLAPAPADASGCWLGPYVRTSSPALGCEVVVFSHPDYGPHDIGVTTQRGGTTVELTGTITQSTTNLDVFYGNYACDGSPIVEYTESQEYIVYRIALTGAQVGDALMVSGVGSAGTVTAAGACVEDTSTLSPFCTGRNSGYPCEDDPGTGGGGSGPGDDDEDDDVGCNAGGPGAAGVLLALVGLVGRRRRVRPAA